MSHCHMHTSRMYVSIHMLIPHKRPVHMYACVCTYTHKDKHMCAYVCCQFAHNFDEHKWMWYRETMCICSHMLRYAGAHVMYMHICIIIVSTTGVHHRCHSECACVNNAAYMLSHRIMFSIYDYKYSMCAYNEFYPIPSNWRAACAAHKSTQQPLLGACQCQGLGLHMGTTVGTAS